MYIALVLVGFVVVFLTYYVWSRRRFYMLSMKVPGPYGWPFLGFAPRLGKIGDLLGKFNEMANIYKSDTIFGWGGPVPVLVTRDPVVAEKILNSPNCVDRPSAYKVFREGMGDGLLTIGPPKYFTHRKMLSPAFNHNILVSFLSIFNGGADFLNEEFDKLVGNGANVLTSRVYRCTLRVSIETTLGLSSEEFRDKAANLLRYTNIIFKTTLTRLIYPWLRIDSVFRMSHVYKPFKEAKDVVDKFINDAIKERILVRQQEDTLNKSLENRKEADNPNNNVDIKKKNTVFIDQVLGFYCKNLFDWNDIYGELNSMIYASFGTTATTLNNALLMLAMHPNYQEKLYEEVISVFPEENFKVTYVDLAKLTYMDMFINETLRIAATAPLVARHADGDVPLTDSIIIPKGMEIIIDIFNVHRNPNVWGPNATNFNPDNFLPENMAGKHPYAFIPFSKGSRNCMGWRYATIFLKVLLSKLIRRFLFATTFKFKDLEYSMNVTLTFKVSPKLEVHRR